MPIVISSLADMPDLVRNFGVRDLVSVIHPEAQPRTPSEIDPARHHRCAVHDIVQPSPGKISPQTKDIEALIKFLDTWDSEVPLLVHCLAGVSRSTAVALVAHTLKTGDPRKSAQTLREASPYAWPNRRILALADSILGLDGELTKAREAMGPASWEADPNYVAPRLQGQRAAGYQLQRFTTLHV
ncbi:MAG: protein tyrosine phosphatase [Gammaproteobacteria bacterium]|nr:protein tyrosine phosphatase [Gammaproteobacteria bacterium]